LKNIKNFDISYSRIWFLAWPIVLSNITIPLIGATNVAVVGRLESPIYIGAVALGVLVLQCIYWSFAFLRKSTTALTAQAFGEGDQAGVFATLVRSLVIASALGLIVTLLQQPIESIAFRVIEGSAEVEELAKVYFKIRIWGSIATMSNYVFLGWFYGIQKPKLALVLRVLMNILNIPLAIYLGLTLKMGVAGVAWAAFYSQHFVCVISYIAAFVILYRHLKEKSNSEFKLDKDFFKLIFDKVKFTRLYSINSDIFFRTLLVFFVFSWFTSKGASNSDLILATNAILINLFWFISYALDGFSNAAESLVGQAVGANKIEMYKKAVKVTTLMSFVFACFFVLIYALFGNYFVSVLTPLASIQDLARIYLPWLVFIPLIGVWCFQLDGIFFGATQTRVMRDMMFISFIVYSIAVYFLPKFFDNHGLWMALYVFMIVRAITLFWHLPKIKEHFTNTNPES
jgi:multidrug resistance protein, MATE family